MKAYLKNIKAILTRREKRRLLQLFIADALISILDIASLLLLLLIINFYTRSGTTSFSKYLPSYIASKDSISLIGFFLIAFCIKNAIAYLVQRAQYTFVYSVASRLSEYKLQQYLEGTYLEHVSVDSSVYIRRISQQPVEFSQHVLAGIQQIFTQSFLIIVTVTAILAYNAQLFLLLLITLVPPVILVAQLIKKRTRTARKQVKINGERTLQYIKEALASFIESNIYNSRSFFIKRYSGQQNELNKHLSNLQVVQAIPGRMMEVFAVLGFFILLLISKLGPGMVQSGSLDVLTIGMFMAAAYKIMPGLVKILNAIGQIHTYDYTIKDLLQTAQQGSKLDQHKDSVKIRSVEFNNISFSYDGHSVLSGFSASMKKSGIIGINGISGKGKTTLINLLLGFVKPDNGTLFFNDQEMCTDSLRQYWPAISYVKQSPFLINDSILKNITLDEFDHDERKMNQVIDECGLRPLLSRYRSGIHHCITENGKDISGGQRQRIALARALYKDADLIILDEPFNELDRASEDDLLRLFTGLAWRGKMILLITHNKESLSHCDKIISLDAA